MKYKIIIPLILILMIQIVSAITVEISTDNTTWVSFDNITYAGGIDETEGIATAQNLNCSTEYFLRVKNASTAYNYTSITTDDCGEDEPMAALAITVFILLVTGSLFLLSMKKEILKNKYANLMVKRSLLVLGIYLMILNSAIMATIAVDAGIALEQEMFFYMKLIGLCGYPSMLFLMLSGLIQTLKDMKMDKKNERTGEDDEYGE